jgi:hypothetical protein
MEAPTVPIPKTESTSFKFLIIYVSQPLTRGCRNLASERGKSHLFYSLYSKAAAGSSNSFLASILYAK